MASVTELFFINQYMFIIDFLFLFLAFGNPFAVVVNAKLVCPCLDINISTSCISKNQALHPNCMYISKIIDTITIICSQYKEQYHIFQNIAALYLFKPTLMKLSKIYMII